MAEQLLAVSERDANYLQIAVRQITGNAGIYIVLSDELFVCPEVESFEPNPQWDAFDPQVVRPRADCLYDRQLG